MSAIITKGWVTSPLSIFAFEFVWAILTVLISLLIVLKKLMARRRRPDQSRNNTSETSESNGMTSVNELNKSAPSSNGKIETVKAMSEDSNGVEEETRDKTETLHTIEQETKETTKQEQLNENKESNGITSNACGIFKQKKEINGSNNKESTVGTKDGINNDNNDKDNGDDNDNDSKEEEYEVEMKHVCTPEDKVAALNAFALYSTERLKEIENDVIHSNERCKSKNDNADVRQSNSLNREESEKKDGVEGLSKSNDVKQINVGENHNVVNESSSNSKNNHSNVDNTSDDSLRPSLSTSEDRQTPNSKASHKIKRVHIITPAIELLPADLDNNQHPRETRCLESTCAKCVIM